MAGYTRQSAASIINGENITAPPINAEFNTLQDAFNGTTGHAHDGTTGNGPKIDLATSVSGFLPAVNGGLGGKNNYAATTDPTVGDDTNDGYAVGSVWYNVPDDRYYVCVYNAAGAAVWLENRFINSSGDFAPHANNTKDLGHTLKRWKDLFLSGNADIDGSLNVATTTYLGGILTVNANAIFNVGTTTTISNIDVASGAIDNAAIGTTVAASGTFTTLSATTSLTAATADINGGSIDGATVGANSHSTGKFTTLESTGLATLNSVNIDGGAIDGAVIGANSAVAGSFTTISSAGQATLASVDINGGAIDGATIGANSASPITGTTITGTSLVGPVTGNLTGNSSGTHTGPVTGAVTGNLTGNVTSSGTSTFNNVTIDGTLNMNAGTSATITNLSAPTNDNDAARKVDVDNAVANLVDSAPGTLDTLNELAAALGDDPDFATTITNSIATKLPLAGGTMTGAIAMSTNKITGVGDPTAAQDVSSKAYTDQQDALQVTKSGDSMSGNLAMGSNNITGLATPTANDHASNKSYVDGLFQSTQAASTSAANAATSESNAATSETNASNSAASALNSKNAAATSLATFQNQYLGAQGSAPTADPDGSALDVGDLYFDTTAGAMKVYSANGWTNAGSSVNGTTNRYSYTATAGQTVFAATYDAGYVDVFLNGVKQVIGSTKDVTATTGTSIVFNSATSVNDVVDIIGYGTFVLADHLTQAQSDARYVEVAGDTMTGNLAVEGTVSADDTIFVTGTTDALIKATAASGSNASLKLLEAGTGDVGAEFQYDGTANQLNFKIANNLDKTRMSIARDSGDISFYDTSGNAKFFWDSSDVKLGIGTSSPNFEIQVYDPSSHAEIHVGTSASSDAQVPAFSLSNTASTWSIGIKSDDALHIRENSASYQSRVTVLQGGDVGLKTTLPVTDLHINHTANNITPAQLSSANCKDLGLYIANNNESNVTGSIYAGLTLAEGYAGLYGYDNGGSAATGLGIFTGTNTTVTEKMAINATGKVTFNPYSAGADFIWNEGSVDADFRVESDSNTHALFVDAGNNNVNVRNAVTTDPSNSMNIRGNIRLGADTATRGDIIRSAGGASSAYNGMVLMSNHINASDQANSSLPSWLVDIGGSWADGTNSPPSTADGITIARRAAGGTKYSSAKYLGINSTATVINEDGNDHDFRVESNNKSQMMLIDGGQDRIAFGNGNTSRAFFTIDNDSGESTKPTLYVEGYPSSAPTSIIRRDNTDAQYALELWHDAPVSGSSGTGYMLKFADRTGITLGSITSAGASGTTYNTTSDRRLKDNIETITDGTDKLMAMNPVTHTWKANSEAPAVHGFIAQEMQEIVPEAVSGEPEGEEMMSMDYGRITPVLVAALQDAHKKIEALEKRLAELEAR
jgi:hypothetical protein